nr:MAG: hypothetical protein [Bacteriophage sp.]
MAKKKETKKVELKEVSRVEINGNIIITYEDGSVKIIPAPIMLTADQASEIFGSDDEDEDDSEEDEEDDEDEDDSEEDEEDEEDEDEEDEEDEDEDDSDEDEEDEEDEEEEEEELTGEALAEMDFEELEDVCDDKDLDTDPDDFDEEDIEKLRKAIAKELGIKLPAKKEAKGKGKKGKK